MGECVCVWGGGRGDQDFSTSLHMKMSQLPGGAGWGGALCILVHIPHIFSDSSVLSSYIFKTFAIHSHKKKKKIKKK